MVLLEINEDVSACFCIINGRRYAITLNHSGKALLCFESLKKKNNIKAYGTQNGNQDYSEDIKLS